MYNSPAVCPGGLKDKVTVSGAVDTGSIPVRDAMKPRNPHELPAVHRECEAFIIRRCLAEGRLDRSGFGLIDHGYVASLIVLCVQGSL